ncbi:MAG TPA: RNA polymerase subunit sigma-24 [Elusimicrobia bacterium]|nr:RNA polymerase subunit sigma-24 [Elusimicrobiota bacterium]
MRDRDHVLSARQGDERAFARLMELYGTAAYRLAFRITGDTGEAEDACQEAFLRAYRSLDSFDAERPFLPWILRIAANCALTRAHAKKRECPLSAADGESDPKAGVEESAERASEAERLRRALEELEAHDRAVLGLRYEQDMRVAEIAEVLGIGESAVKLRLFRARSRLKRVLEPTEAGA